MKKITPILIIMFAVFCMMCKTKTNESAKVLNSEHDVPAQDSLETICKQDFLELEKLQKDRTTPYDRYMLNGKLFSGCSKQVFENNKQQYRYSFIQNGILQRQIGYYVNGQVDHDFNLVDGLPHGPERMWMSDGHLYIEHHYENGKQEGYQRRWHSNHVLAREGYYRDGVAAFDLFFDPEGELIEAESILPSVVNQSPQLFHIEEDGIFADNRYPGANLHDFKKIGEAEYQATLVPENIPINASPWYGFKLWSETPKTVKVKLVYTEHKHRFIPKLSKDGRNWTPMEASSIVIDEATRSATLTFDLDSQPLWISAQENLDVAYFYDWLKSLSGTPGLEKKSFGKSKEGQELVSLEVRAGKSVKAVVLIGRQHPPEVPGATIALEAFLETMLTETPLATSFRQEYEIIAIPMANPDGVDRGYWRHNANGFDLNRDWKRFLQPETQAIRDYIQGRVADGLEIVYGLDFHTSYSGPYLLVKDTANQTSPPVITNRMIANIENNWENYEVEQRPRSQDLPYCYNWFFNTFNAEAVTYEEGDEVERDLVQERAARYAIALMQALTE
ncbi:MAG: M14 family zinc carboxypeptidase [Bacteroidota bacterium]